MGGCRSTPTPGSSSTAQTVNGLEAIWSVGANVTDTTGQVTFDRAAWQQGLAQLTRPGMVLPASQHFDEGLSRAAFGDGRVLFMRNWPIAFRDLSAGDPTTHTAPVPFQVALPPGPSVLGGQNLAIAKNTPRPRAAQALIEFLTGEPSQRMLFEGGGFAATQKAVYDNRAVQRDNPYLTVLRAALEQARLRPITPYYADFSRQFQQGLQRALADHGDIEPDLGDRLTKALHGH